MEKKGEKISAAFCSIAFGLIAAGALGPLWHSFTALGIWLLVYNPKPDTKSLANIFRQTGLTKKAGDLEDVPKVLRRKETESGFEAVLSLPVGLSSRDFQRKSQPVAEALNADVDFTYANGKILMKAIKNTLKKVYPFKVQELPGPVEIPVGYSATGFISLPFGDTYSNLLVGGVPGSGKSVFLRQMIASLIVTKPSVKIHLIDLKAVEFAVFSGCVESLSINEQDTLRELTRLEKLCHERYRVMRYADTVNIWQYNRKCPPLDPHIIIIDEYALLRNNDSIQQKLYSLLSLGRAAGLYFVVCTQRPSADVIGGLLKAQIQATLAFRTRNELNSRILLDDGDAAYLDNPGRGILQTDRNREVQVMYLSDDDAREMVRPYARKVKMVEAPATQNNSGVMSLADYERSRGH